MTSSFDLILLPLFGFNRQDQGSLPGLYLAKPPRRAARGRDRDWLILYLTLSGNAPLQGEQVNKLLSRLAQSYYKISGSVTAAQRSVAEALNQYLLDRNLRNTSAGKQSIGLLSQVVLRSGRLWLAQSGPTHAFVVTSGETEHLYDLTLAGRGLGLSRTVSVKYSQAALKVNDTLILSPEPPAVWTPATLQSASRQGPESLRRRLLTQATPDLEAVLMQAQKGNHKIHLLRPVRAPRPRPASLEVHETIREEPAVSKEGQSEISGVAETPAEEKGEQVLRPGSGEVLRPVSGQAAQRPSHPALADQAPERPAQEAVQTEENLGTWPTEADRRPPPQKGRQLPPLPKPNLGPIYSALAVIGRAFAEAGRQLAIGTGTLAKRMLPDSSLFTIPPATMAFIAIAVPVIVVTIASLVYFQRGRAAQHQIYLAQAIQTAQQAQEMEDPQELRLAWGITLEYLNQAEVYQTTKESEALRAQAQGALDALNYVERLDYRLALTSELKDTATISRMVSMDNDLYLLNSAEGVAMKATFTNKGYVLDPTFQCGPGPYGGYIVGAIVDIAPLPKDNDAKATILGIDANGNMLYCTPGEAPLALPMAPPDTNWGAPKAVVQDSGDLYILDPLTNAVWIYRGMEVGKQPRLFFGDQIPSMRDVIDLTVNNNDLYLLHDDGQLTTCVYNGLAESPTRCEEPAPYSDPRPGMEGGAHIQDGQFTEIQFSPPPDPSIYLLEPDSKAIYHFSVRLTLQRQFQSSSPLPEGPATSFAINRNSRTMFLATGNQVYYANLP